ncbi:MAG TPA: hypothetical protein PLR07_13065, partial [Promineifilum sp.]|nr:hypothetical protein [Promineifilum sp.]
DPQPNYVFPHEGDGGGIFQTGGTLTIVDSEISGNTSNSPDCFYDYNYSTPVCTYAYGKGGGIYQNDGDLSITNSTVSGNTAGQEGGGLFFSDYYTDGDMAVITGSVFEGNHAGNEGGGIYTRHSDLTLSNSTVSGNTADNEGGGLYFGSSYTNSGYPDYNDLPSTDYALITDSRFENNESFYNEGGA